MENMPTVLIGGCPDGQERKQMQQLMAATLNVGQKMALDLYLRTL